MENIHCRNLFNLQTNIDIEDIKEENNHDIELKNIGENIYSEKTPNFNFKVSVNFEKEDQKIEITLVPFN